MKISLICATSGDNVIGIENKLPWKLPADLKHFKEITKNHTVIMGRKTYESIGGPLPNRNNIVLTRQENYHPTGCTVAQSIEEAVGNCEKKNEDEIFVIGGADIYRQTLPIADRLFLTRVHAKFEGDAYLENFNQSEWRVVSNQDFSPDSKNLYPYSFITLERR